MPNCCSHLASPFPLGIANANIPVASPENMGMAPVASSFPSATNIVAHIRTSPNIVTNDQSILCSMLMTYYYRIGACRTIWIGLVIHYCSSRHIGDYFNER